MNFNSQKEDIYWFDHSRMAKQYYFKKDDKFKGKTNNTVNKGKDWDRLEKYFQPMTKDQFSLVWRVLQKQPKTNLRKCI